MPSLTAAARRHRAFQISAGVWLGVFGGQIKAGDDGNGNEGQETWYLRGWYVHAASAPR